MHLVADVAVQTYPLAAEGPVWCVKQQCLYYVDMAHKAKGKLHCYNPVKKADVVYDIPALHPPITQVTAVAPCRSAQRASQGGPSRIAPLPVPLPLSLPGRLNRLGLHPMARCAQAKEEQGDESNTW